MRTTPSSPAPTAEHDDFMDPKEAAKDIGCGERFLRDGANQHGFPHHRFGKYLQFSAQDRAEIRKLCRRPAEPAKLAAFKRANKQAPSKQRKSAA